MNPDDRDASLVEMVAAMDHLDDNDVAFRWFQDSGVELNQIRSIKQRREAASALIEYLHLHYIDALSP